MSQLSEHLNALLERFHSARGDAAARLIDDTLTLEVLQQFQRSVDAMRRLLWAYIQAASLATAGNIDDAIHGPRLQGEPKAQIIHGAQFVRIFEQNKILLRNRLSFRDMLGMHLGESPPPAQSRTG